MLVATAAMVLTDPADPTFDCCACCSSHALICMLAGMGLGGGIAGGGLGRRRSNWLIVLCGDGMFENAFHH